jgi:protein PhnA
MDELPPCPQCQCVNTYPMGTLLVCPECAYEWVPGEESKSIESDAAIRDAVGNILADGDTVTIIKDMKVKGSSNTLKVGTRVRNIRLVPGPGGHDVEAKVDGFGPMYLKSSIMKKA